MVDEKPILKRNGLLCFWFLMTYDLRLKIIYLRYALCDLRYAGFCEREGWLVNCVDLTPTSMCSITG
jgi:hypothetical protein